jgi:uncharacterized membrane protein
MQNDLSVPGPVQDAPNLQPTSPPTPIEPQPANEAPIEEQPKKQNGWVKFLRVVLWGVIIAAITTGIALLATSQNVNAFANGTYAAREWWGRTLLICGIIASIAHLAWGATRWFLRWRNEKWKTSKVVGKIIGGGIWRFFAAVPVVLIACFLIAPAINSSLTNRIVADREARLTTSVMKIEGDFVEGNITTDQYIRYLVDIAYNRDALPSEYKDDQTIFAPHILEELETNLAALNQETIKYALNAITLANVNFGVDASSNISSALNPATWQPNTAYARTSNVTTLNKAKLSSNEKFLIFYTDTGDDQISDTSAADIAAMLDGFITNYESRLGLTYSYEKIGYKGNNDWFGKTAEEKMQTVLENSGIDKKHLNTAMPVYIANPYSENTGVLATYAGRRFGNTLERVLLGLADVFGDETSDFYNSSPILPFINILPQNIDAPDLALVTAHELGHHYASNYCYDNFNKNCSDNDFIGETAANYMAINVVDNQPSGTKNNTINYHHSLYIGYGHCYSIPNIVNDPPKQGACHKKGSFEGYPTVAYLDNYASIVPDGNRKILNALVQDNAFQYLYEQAQPNYNREVLVQLAQRNLTNAYGNKQSLYSEEIPKGEDVPCYTLCTAGYTSNYATTQYFYFPTSEFNNKKITGWKSNTEDWIAVSVLGRKSGSWEFIDSSFPLLEYTIHNNSDYDVIAFAITNYAKEGTGRYAITIEDGELEEIIDNSANLQTPNFNYNGDCLWFEVNDLLDGITQVMRSFNGFAGTDISGSISEWEQNAEEVKSNVNFRKMTICANRLQSHTAFDDAKARVRNSIGWAWEILNVRDSNGNISVMANYDIFRQSMRMYMLYGYEDEMWLYSVMTEQ